MTDKPEDGHWIIKGTEIFWTGSDFAMIDNGDGTLSMPKEVIEKLRAAEAND
jgi:hypothetical protein